MDPNLEIVKYLCQTRLDCFTRMAFGWIYPQHDYIHHWSMELIGDALTRCHNGQVKRLIINMPPRSLKSFYASVAFPAWLLARQPDTKIMCIAGGRGLAVDHHELTRKLMTHSSYRALFPHIKMSESGQTIRLHHGGSRSWHVASPGGGITGRGADIIIIDDPQGTNYADDDNRREAINVWYEQNIYQRLDNKQKGVIIVLMQRLHVDDLTAHLLKQDDWELLSLPAIAMEDETFTLGDGRTVGRLKGEPLNPVREDRDQLRQAMLKIKAQTFMSQYQQDPYPPGKGGERGGAFHIAPYPDATEDECKGAQFFFGRMPEELFVLDRVFGERTFIRPGTAPPFSDEEYMEWIKTAYPNFFENPDIRSRSDMIQKVLLHLQKAGLS